MRLFIDSDVVISSLLSLKGAAHVLFHTSEITRLISTTSLKELHIVCKRLDIQEDLLEKLVRQKCITVKISDSKQIIKHKYLRYVSDPNDAHIIAGAVTAKAQFLISYNLKHFKKEKIKEELNIFLMTPSWFLQFFRSN